MSRFILAGILAFAVIVSWPQLLVAADEDKSQSFDTPRAAAEAFLTALEKGDREAIRAMLTPALRAILKDPERFDTALSGWLDERGRGLTIDGIGEPKQTDASGTWRASAFLHFKGEGDAVMNTLLSTVSKDKKHWQIEL